MDKLQHQERHKKLHDALDELSADFISQTGKLPSQASIMELMEWSFKQTTNPTDLPDAPPLRDHKPFTLDLKESVKSWGCGCFDCAKFHFNRGLMYALKGAAHAILERHPTSHLPRELEKILETFTGGEGTGGLEPPTAGFRIQCSTN